MSRAITVAVNFEVEDDTPEWQIKSLIEEIWVTVDNGEIPDTESDDPIIIRTRAVEVSRHRG